MISRRHVLASGLALGLGPQAFAQKAAAPEPASPPPFMVPPDVEPFKVDMNEWKLLQTTYQRQEVAYDSRHPVGTIVVDTSMRLLYLITAQGRARRWGCSVGKQAKAWTGEAQIRRMGVWPIWMPAPYHLAIMPSLSKWIPGGMPGGLENPLGARALYLYQNGVDTLNRIHGGAKREWIGDDKTAGCFSMLNCDVIDLYARVHPGANVVVEHKGLFG